MNNKLYGILYLPKPTGPFPVGTIAHHVVDTSRKEEFYADQSGPWRELMVQIWYPAECNNMPTVAYAPEAVAHWKQKLRACGIAEEKLGVLDQIFSSAEQGIPLSSAQPTYGVLIFCPGYGQMRTQNTALCENIASHGYIVVSIDHTFMAESVTFPDGRVVPSSPSFMMDTPERQAYLQAMLVADVVSVLKQLAFLNENDPLLRGRLDLRHCGIFGHSIGGSTAVNALHHVPQLLAGINVDGGIVGERESFASFKKPCMFLIAEQTLEWYTMDIPDEKLSQYGFKSRAEREEMQKKGLPVIEALCHKAGEDGYRIILKNTGHMSFCDSVFFKDIAVLAPLLFLRFGIGTISGERAHHLAVACIVSFFNKHLRNGQGIIRQELAQYAEIAMLPLARL